MLISLLFMVTISLDTVISHPQMVAPKSVYISPDGKTAYVNNLEGMNTLIFDVVTRKVKGVIKHIGKPVESCFSEGGRYVWISYYRLIGKGYPPCPNWREYKIPSVVAVYDTVKKALVRKVKVGVIPKIIEASPDGKYVFVSNWNSHSVTVVDAETFEVKEEIKVGWVPRGVAFTNDSRFAYVVNMGGFTISKIDVDSLKAVKVISKAVGNRPRHIVATPDSNYMLFSCHGDGYIRKLDIKADSIIDKVKVGHQPRTITLDPSGRYLFVVNYKSNSVSIVDVDLMTEVAEEKTGLKPVGCDLTPDGGELWVTDYSSGSIHIYKIQY
ncbi:MAG TPA: YncE family protein [bacterium (Candidatus Stahlbacteria)]|nr:YncE family protein [Candidatus Stahlbacteria bacterium]